MNSKPKYLVPDEAKVEGCVRHNIKEAGLVNQAIGNLLLWTGHKNMSYVKNATEGGLKESSAHI